MSFLKIFLFKARSFSFSRKLLFLFAAVTLVFSVSASVQELSSEKAEIIEVNGNVRVSVPGTREYKSAEAGMKLSENDKVRTLLNASAIIKSFDGSLVSLGENTSLDISSLKKDALGNQSLKYKLWIGRLKAEVSTLPTYDSEFEIETPTAVAGVRGTTFDIEVDKDRKTNLSVAKGSVYFRTTAGVSAIVNANQKISSDNPVPVDDGDTLPYDEEQEGDLTLNLITPQDNHVTALPAVNFQGITAPYADVSIQNQSVRADASGNFLLIVNLPSEGEYDIIVTAEKGVEEVSVSRKIKVKITPPQLNIQNDMNIATNNPVLTINGTTEKDATLLINNRAVRLTGGAFSYTLNLTEGQNAITVTASDMAGNQTIRVINALLDTIAPVLVIMKSEISANGNLYIEGYTEAGAEVLVNDYPINVRSNGTFSQEVTWVKNLDSSNIEVTARDKAGNVTRTISTVTGLVSSDMDMEPPKFVSFSYTPSSVKPGDNISVTVGATDNVQLARAAKLLVLSPRGTTAEITLNLSGNHYTGTLTLAADAPLGDYTFTTLTLSDKAGNITQTEINKTFKVEQTLNPPESLTASSGSSSIFLTWTQPAGTFQGYKVYRRDGAAGGFVYQYTISDAGVTGWEDMNVEFGIIYYYYVTTYDATGESAASNTANAELF